MSDDRILEACSSRGALEFCAGDDTPLTKPRLSFALARLPAFYRNSVAGGYLPLTNKQYIYLALVHDTHQRDAHGYCHLLLMQTDRSVDQQRRQSSVPCPGNAWEGRV